MNTKRQFIKWRTDFFTGLAIVLPIVLTLAIASWLFHSISSFTNIILFFIPKTITHNEYGQMHWYWSAIALIIAIVLVAVLGRLARYYIGRKIISLVDRLMTQLPLLNKIYTTIKQVNEAFTGKRTAFKKVVMVPFPQQGCYSIGFIVSENYPEFSRKLQTKIVGVFIPTTPNPTTGFLVMFPENEIIYLNMSVADGVKLILSLGAVTPEYQFGEFKINGK